MAHVHTLSGQALYDFCQSADALPKIVFLQEQQFPFLLYTVFVLLLGMLLTVMYQEALRWYRYHRHLQTVRQTLSTRR